MRSTCKHAETGLLWGQKRHIQQVARHKCYRMCWTRQQNAEDEHSSIILMDMDKRISSRVKQKSNGCGQADIGRIKQNPTDVDKHIFGRVKQKSNGYWQGGIGTGKKE